MYRNRKLTRGEISMKVPGARKENGQVLIIIVVGLIGLIGFAALAIDGGMALSDRRNDQNGADAAALAGANAAAVYMENQNITYANFACPLDSGTLSAASTGAITRALDNHFTVVAATAIPQSNAVWVENCVKQPFGTRFDVHVRIATNTRTSLIQLFYGGPVINTVDSVARVVPRHPLGYGAAIASLSPNCATTTSNHATTASGGVRWAGGGNGVTNIVGGGIFSNSCLDASGSPYINAYSSPGQIAPSGTIAFHWPTSTGLTGSAVNFNNTQPSPVHSDDFLKTISYSPQCSKLPNGQSPTNGQFNQDPNKTLEISPGNYHGISVPNQSTLKLRPGLYCITGDFNLSAGGSLLVDPYPQGGGEHPGVTIFMENGRFDAAGSPTVHIYASTEFTTNKNASGCTSSRTDLCAIPGLLIYSPPGNTNQINMGGSGTFTYDGSIYAPSGWIDMGGSGDASSTYNAEIIGWVVVLHGTNNINIHYDPSGLPTVDASLSQYK